MFTSLFHWRARKKGPAPTERVTEPTRRNGAVLSQVGADSGALLGRPVGILR